MLTTKDLEERLATTSSTVDALIEVGLINPAQATTVGRIRLWPDELVDQLNWPQIPDQHPAALVVKVKGRQPVPPSQVENEGRDHIGWTPGLDPMAIEQRTGIDRWWRVKDAESLVGKAYLVTAKGWILAPYTIVDVATFAGLRSFELEEPKGEIAQAFAGKRIISRKGPLVERLPDTRTRQQDRADM